MEKEELFDKLAKLDTLSYADQKYVLLDEVRTMIDDLPEEPEFVCGWSAVDLEIKAAAEEADAFDEGLIQPGEQLYDRDRFNEALQHMQDNMDANYGTTWEHVLEALDACCKLEKEVDASAVDENSEP